MAKEKRRKRKGQAERLGERPRRRLPRGVWIMMLILLLILLSVAVYRLVPDDALPVKEVRVSGDLRHLGSEEIRQKALPYLDRDFFSVDIQSIERVVGAMPWVYEVSVRRVWPDRIEIHILEQEAVARWGDEAVLNPYGEVFRPEQDAGLHALPLVFGPESRRHELIRSFLDIHDQLFDIGLNLMSLVEDRRGSWMAGLANGLNLSLGQREQGPRLQRFIQAYPGLIAHRKDQVQHIDLRYSNGLAIAWKQQPDGENPREKED